MEDFNLKKFLTENKLTRNSRLLKEEQEGILKNIYNEFTKIGLEHIDSYKNKDEILDTINNAKYNTIEELANSLNEINNLFSQGESMGVDSAKWISKICDKLNFKDKLKLLRAYLELDWDYNNYPEDEREEDWNDFLETIGEIE